MRPDLSQIWSLLAATLRLFSLVSGLKRKAKTAAQTNAVNCLLKASTVSDNYPNFPVSS